MSARLAASVAIYVALGLVMISVLNADAGDSVLWLFVALIAAALLVGWNAWSASHRWAWAFLPLCLLVAALPFGETNKVTGGDTLYPVAIYMLVPVVVAVGLGQGARLIHGRSSTANHTG